MTNDSKRTIKIARWLSMLVMLASLLIIMRLLPLDRAAGVMNDWIEGLGIWGPVALALIYVVATVLFVPGTILTLAAGALFGMVVGTLTVSVGSTLGAAAAFLIARYGAREKVAAMARGNWRFGAIDRAIGEGGWKIVALLRLSPAIPFNLQNYLYGLTPIRFWPYVLTSWLAMLPGTFLYVYLGHATKAAVGTDHTRTPAEWAMLVVGLLATLVVTVYITRLARQKLNAQMEEVADEEDSSSATKEEKPSAESKRPSLLTTALLIGAALASVGGAAYVTVNSETLESRLANLFGPPQVEMNEAYEEDMSGPSFDHSLLNALLDQHVDAEGWVDYEALSNDEPQLDQYLEAVAAAPFDEMGRNEKLVLLINAYNAFTLKLIIEHQPIDSIMEIPEDKRWNDVRWHVGGNVWSLGQIEHEQIRPRFVEPRIHFALVCAAVGCPPLRNEAYATARLDEQLASQSEYVHGHATWFQFDAQANVVRLTKLYYWYGDDFQQAAGGILPFAADYSPELETTLANDAAPSIEWLPYDWQLNSMNNKQPR